MKKVILFCLTAILLGACSLQNVANYTPVLYSYWPYVHMQDSARWDSLRIAYDTNTSRYVIDTLHVGDTMRMYVSPYTYANNLDSFVVAYDHESMEFFYDSLDYAQILPYLSDSTGGSTLRFQKGLNGVNIFLYSRSKKSGKHSVTLKVYSDAQFEKEPGMNACSASYDVLVVE